MLREELAARQFLLDSKVWKKRNNSTKVIDYLNRVVQSLERIDDEHIREKILRELEDFLTGKDYVQCEGCGEFGLRETMEPEYNEHEGFLCGYCCSEQVQEASNEDWEQEMTMEELVSEMYEDAEAYANSEDSGWYYDD